MSGPSIVKAMKLTAFILLVCCLHVGARSASQNITFSGKDLPLEKVFAEIKRQTGYVVFYDQAVLQHTRPVTFEAKNSGLRDFLKLILEDQNMDFVIRRKNIVITPGQPANELFSAFLPPINISGIVTDEKGSPLEGVSIQVKEGQRGTVTNNEGAYRLTNVPDNATLVFSYVGYKTVEVAIKGRTVISLKLAAIDKSLEETVVNGYFTRSKNSFTGNAVEVKGEELLKVGQRNVIELLQVFDPSFRITQNIQMGSNPNVMPEFYLRGQSGMGITELDKEDLSKSNLATNPNLPVFIMDGYEVSVERVYDFDINRIESVTLLKDAAATAIYGSRASNGVVVIETKRPVSGKLTVSYNLTGSVTAPDLNDYNLMNASEKLEAEVAAGAFIDEYNLPQFTMEKYAEYYGKLNNVLKGVNTYWLSKPLRTGINHKHSVYIEGGEKNTKFGVELRYDNQNGVMKGSVRNRAGAGFFLDYRLKKIQFTNHITFDQVKAENSKYGSFANFTHKLPYDEIYDPVTGKLNPTLKQWHSTNNVSTLVNPLYEETLENFNRQSYNELVNNFSVNWYLLPSLQLKGQLSLSKKDQITESFTDPLSGQYYGSSVAVEKRGALGNSTNNNFGWNTNLLLIYNNRIQRSALTGTMRRPRLRSCRRTRKQPTRAR